MGALVVNGLSFVALRRKVNFVKNFKKLKIISVTVTLNVVPCTETHSKPGETFKIELLAKINDGFQSLATFAKMFIFD